MSAQGLRCAGVPSIGEKRNSGAGSALQEGDKSTICNKMFHAGHRVLPVGERLAMPGQERQHGLDGRRSGPRESLCNGRLKSARPILFWYRSSSRGLRAACFDLFVSEIFRGSTNWSAWSGSSSVRGPTGSES